MKPAKRPIPSDVREKVLGRDGYQCNECGARKDDGAVLHLHHVIEEQFGGTEDPDNLITLCDIHHNTVHIGFQAYYPESRKTIVRMAAITRALLDFIWSALPVTPAWRARLVLKFLTGKTKFRRGQWPVIKALSRNENVLFVTPTGSGKSLCYQLPGLLRNDPTLVISPLKVLVREQAAFLAKKKIPATFINSDVGAQDKRNRIAMIRDKLFRFVFVTPERFYGKSFHADSPLLIRYGLLAVDEAHCIDKWGRHFRPAYAQLGTLRNHLNKPPTLALTASASKDAQDRILRSLKMSQAKRVVTGFYRPEIRLKTKLIKSHRTTDDRELFARKLEALTRFVDNKPQKTIIFVPTIGIGDRILPALHDSVQFFHSKKDAKEREATYQRFREGKRSILIATSAFGMGLNIPDIRRVVHWSIPANLEEYYQQVGRAGRDGKVAQALLLYAPGDEGLTRWMNKKALESATHLGTKDRASVGSIEERELREMLDYLRAKDKWRYVLDYFGERQTWLSMFAKSLWRSVRY
ncbi:MAG: RecQ family ATP-dependent DNA helicase [bacterium]|nr:RecQ family ATP-dependent DNA helicase [bacterium]MDZ4247940.1 RecQ family ATP-dependent DNA helicase [Patescibacteria group bacterium]